MHRRLLRLRRPGFVLALIVSAAAYAYSLSGIVSAGNDLRDVPNRGSPAHQAPAAYDGCRDAPDDSVRL